MSRKPNEEILNKHKNAANLKLSNYLDELIQSRDVKLQGKADKLCYWIEDRITFLNFEPNFSPASLRRYKRGEIIKVHLGFNVGSEEGGLHYAVVVDKNNPKSSPVVTIIPLTSVKPHTDIENLRSGNIYLGNELFVSMNAKLSTTYRSLNNHISQLERLASAGLTNNQNSEIANTIKTELLEAKKEMDFTNRLRDEILKMKCGSIALVNQITTISKIRIYDPKTDHDLLSNIRLSNEKLKSMLTEIAVVDFQSAA